LRTDWLAPYLNTNARILDYGCGYGRTLAQLFAAGYKNIFGVDFSESMLDRCRREVLTAKLVRNDGHYLPLRAGAFDAVLLFAVLTCIPDSIRQRRLLNMIEQALCPGGLLYISDLLLNDDQRNRERYELFAEAHNCYGVFELPEGVAVRHHRTEWIEDLTSSFTQLKYEPFIVTTMNGNKSAAFQYLGRKPSIAQKEA
jgi:SAM-dependent methyltransferase